MKLNILLLLLLLSGCCTPKIIYKDRIIHVDRPVITDIPKIEQIEKPHLPTDDLTIDSTDEETAKAFVTSEKLLKNEVEQLRKALEPFIKKL